MADNTPMLRHFLASLAYRFSKTLKDAPEAFAAFEAGYGIRSPLHLVWHMNGVLGFARNILAENDQSHHHVPELGWQGQIDLLHQTLADIDTLLLEHNYEPALLERLLQGPLADTMTHVGQLAMLRRMADSPIWAENFFDANIRRGKLDRAQPDPVSPDEQQQFP